MRETTVIHSPRGGRPVRVEVGAPIVLHVSSDQLWHIPAPEKIWRSGIRGGSVRRFQLADHASGDGSGTWPTLCGFEDGTVYAYAGFIRRRRCCSVCLQRQRGADLVVPGNGPLHEREPVRRRGKPVWKHARLKPAHLYALHTLYVEQGLGTFRLAELVWDRLGFSSPKSCAQAIYLGFKKLGLPLRSQSEATALKNYRHGRRVRCTGRDSGPEVQAYRRWLKEQRGDYRPVCKAVKQQSPRKGAPCRRPAMDGSEYCWSHSPETRRDRDEQAARMRERLPLQPMVATAGVLEQLRPWLDRQQRPKRALSEQSGVPYGTCSRLLARPPARITEKLASRLLLVLADDPRLQEAA